MEDRSYMNSSLDVIIKTLKSANKIALFPHVRADGDAIGSCVALSLGLKSMGKDCFIVMQEEIPESFAFLESDVIRADLLKESHDKFTVPFCEHTSETYYSNSENSSVCKNAEKLSNIDLSICVDCNSIDRLPVSDEIFLTAPINMSIDHHLFSSIFCDFNYIFPEAAATGELIYEILKALDVTIDAKIAEALYTSIVTDTGNFKYSNTTSKTHSIVSELYNSKINTSQININIFDSKSFPNLKVTGDVLSNLKYICNNKAVICYLTRDMLENNGATPDDSEGIVDLIRTVKGIEIAVFLKEIDECKFKASFRSKGKTDVTGIAKKFDGGGHAKAAGCTIHENIDNAILLLEKELNNIL